MSEALHCIVDFLRGIGLQVDAQALPEDTFLPAIRIVDGGLRYDPARLQAPGDLLHEAGHLAIVAAEQRAQLNDALGPLQPDSATDEVEAIAWSWAALVHLGLPGELLFHAAGYRGNASRLLMSFSLGVYPGAAGLAQRGLCLLPAQVPIQTQAQAAGVQPYPHMLRWLR